MSVIKNDVYISEHFRLWRRNLENGKRYIPRLSQVPSFFGIDSDGRAYLQALQSEQ